MLQKCKRKSSYRIRLFLLGISLGFSAGYYLTPTKVKTVVQTVTEVQECDKDKVIEEELILRLEDLDR